MWPRTEFRHSPQVLLLRESQTVKTHKKEALVECRDRQLCSGLKVGLVDRRIVGAVPGLFPPLLKEVRVAMCRSYQTVESVLRDLHPLVVQRLCDRETSGCVR